MDYSYLMELAGLILVIRNEGPININTDAHKVPKLIKIKSKTLKETGTVST